MAPPKTRQNAANRPHPTTMEVWARFALRAWLAALVVFAILYVFRSIRDLPGEAAEKGAEWVRELAGVAEAFQQGTFETRFAAHSTRVTPSSLFQFAALRQTEVFTRTEKLSLLWGHFELPDVVVSATAPIEYSYYVDFDEPWRFELEDQTLRVTVPRIRHNPPSIEVSKLQWDVRASSVLRDETAAVEALRQGLSRMADRRAKEHVELIREIGRNKIEAFVEQWLSANFGDAPAFRVRVRFVDEDPAAPTDNSGTSAEITVGPRKDP